MENGCRRESGGMATSATRPMEAAAATGHYSFNVDVPSECFLQESNGE